MPASFRRAAAQPRERLRGRHRSSAPRRRGRAAIHAARVLATLLSVTLLLTFGTYWWRYHAFSAGLTRLNIAAPGKAAPDIDGTARNFLIVGNDDRSTATDAELRQLGTSRDGGSMNTDSMMIVHVPADGSSATLISLPRDSYVAIPGFGNAKLNSAYVDGYQRAPPGMRGPSAPAARVC